MQWMMYGKWRQMMLNERSDRNRLRKRGKGEKKTCEFYCPAKNLLFQKLYRARSLICYLKLYDFSVTLIQHTNGLENEKVSEHFKT